MTSNNTPTTARRNWLPCSQRWRTQMEELANLEDDKVTKEDGLTFVPDESRFMILSTGKTEVFLGLWKDGTEIAIKKVHKAIFNKPEFQQELKVLMKLRFNSRHVVQYVDYAQDKYFGYIAMQLCECTLAQYIQSNPAYAERKKRTKEFLKGLKDLHEDAKVIHRDIKPQNILIDKDGRARLADFGISRILDLEQSTVETGNAGTPCWVATEVIKNLQAGMKTRFKCSTDIQVAGMVAYYTLSGGKHPFGDVVHCQSNICDGKYTLEDLDDEQAKDLVKKMLSINPENRPRITEVLQHPFWKKDSFLPPTSSRKRQAASPLPAQVGGKKSGGQTQEMVTVSEPSLRATNSPNAAQVVVQESGGQTQEMVTVSEPRLRATNSHIPAQVGVQKSGGQTQEMVTVSESSLRTTNSPNTAQVEGQVSGSQTQEMRTVADSSLVDVGRPSQSDAKAFVDRHRAKLIQRVTSVMPIADTLLSKGLLNQEKYSEIRAASTTQEKMRNIYDRLHSAGPKGKAAFYEALLENEPYLVDDLNAE